MSDWLNLSGLNSTDRAVLASTRDAMRLYSELPREPIPDFDDPYAGTVLAAVVPPADNLSVKPATVADPIQHEYANTFAHNRANHLCTIERDYSTTNYGDHYSNAYLFAVRDYRDRVRDYIADWL